MLQHLQYLACTNNDFMLSTIRRIYGGRTQQCLTAELAVTEVEATATVHLTLLTSVEMSFSLNSAKFSSGANAFRLLPSGLSWQVKDVCTCPRAGLYKTDLPVVACSFDVYLEMAVVQMMYTHVTLLCPPPQQQVWALLGGGSCRAICSSPSPRRRSCWLSKIILSVEMLYGCRSRIEHA